MYLVYKLDHLFQSTRVSDENLSVTKTFHFSNLISTQDFFSILQATFKATYLNSILQVSSFDLHKMCAKVERITTKIGCTSCTNWTISFKVQGFQTKTYLLQRHFIFLSLFQLKTFFIQHATFKATY